MQLDLSEDQALFRETPRKFLTSEVPLSVVRSLYETADGFDRDWWLGAVELGFTSFFVPEELGGGSVSGSATADAVIVAEEMGRLVSPGPFLPVNVVAAAVAWEGDDALAAELLPRISTGEVITSWAFGEPVDQWRPELFRTTASVDGTDVVVDGEKAYVEAAGVADLFLVTAREAGD